VFGDRTFPIGHAALAGRVPVVIAPAGAGLDTPSSAFGDGMRRRSAFGLAQEFLNADENALWGLVTDGVTLRLVRGNASLTRPAWIEADLSRLFAADSSGYPDFSALWLLIHESRFGREGERVHDGPLEAWRQEGREEGTRAREKLRDGVEAALRSLGQGFISHPANEALRERLRTNALTQDAYFQQLLRLVYRVIFLLTIEERGLLHPEGTDDAARRLYADGYSLKRLRDRALRRSAFDRYSDAWEAVRITFRGLAGGESMLGLPALAGLFAASQCPDLDSVSVQNRDLLTALYRLSWIKTEAGLARVNWRDMGAEEFGGVYESLLELVPQLTKNTTEFSFATGAETKGNARKTTGSYYTPDSLVQVLLDSALEPVIQETAAKNPGSEADALLELSIVDPACGSGHFLLAAARRLAGHVARATANGTPTAAEYRHALRQVVSRCIYGVDLNQLAVELCRVGLWLEAVEPGRPMTFLDSHIQHGNALLGTTPEVMAKGIPDSAWDPIEGDDRTTATGLKKRNKGTAAGQRSLDTLWSAPVDKETESVTQAVAELEAASDVNVEALAAKEQRWGGILKSAEYRHQKFVADAWCAAFVWPKQPGGVSDAAPTNGLWRQIRDQWGNAPAVTTKTVGELESRYRFFHWHLQFPQVFAKGGFDVVLGNPPWDSLEAPEGAGPEDLRQVREVQAFIARCGVFPLSGSGRKNLYALFVERTLGLMNPTCRAGLVVPTELVQAAETEALSRQLFVDRRLVSLCDFQNRRTTGHKWFSDVDSRYRFSLITLAANAPVTRFMFDAQSPKEINGERSYLQTTADVLRLCPDNSFRVPMFPGPSDARIISTAYSDSTLIGNLPETEIASGLMFNFGKTEKELKISAAFAGDRSDLVCVLEGENIHQFDHRFGTLNGSYEVVNALDTTKHNPTLVASTSTYLPRAFVSARIKQMFDANPSWFVALRRQARSNDSYISIAAFVPAVAVEGSLTVFSGRIRTLIRLGALLNSYLLNFLLARRQSGPNVNKGMYGLLPLRLDSGGIWASAPMVDLDLFVQQRAIELSYTAWDLEHFARDVGYDGPPFRWDENRRFHLRCEIDAAFFHLYGISRDDTDYVMETFPIVRRNDEKAYGEYRTKRVILEIYDAMAEAARTGVPYQTRLDPPPADPRVAHPESTRPPWAKKVSG